MSAKTPPKNFTRATAFDRAKMDAASRTIELAFASEMPVERMDYRIGQTFDEVLACNPTDADLARLNNGHPLLLNHDTEKQIGVVEKAWIDGDGKARASVRFGNGPLASEIWQDVTDGIRRLVSVGYTHTRELSRAKVEGREAVKFAWSAHEISIVPIPADDSVGVNRDATETIVTPKSMSDPITPTAPAPAPAPVNVQSVREDAARNERQRIADINTIAEVASRANPAVKGEVARALSEGLTADQFRAAIFPLITNAKPISSGDLQPGIGMSDREVSRYSLSRALSHMTENAGIPKDGIEFEVHRELEKRLPKGADRQGGLLVPFDVMWKRDQLVGTGSLGGNLVENSLRPDQFVQLLRNKLVVGRAGATILPGLTSNVLLPRQTVASTAYWAASEIATTTESTLNFDQITLSPKCVTGWVQVGKQTMIQSNPAIDSLVRADLNQQLDLAIDLAALHGSGASGQPTGVAAVSGIGSVAGGTNGAAPTWANLVALEAAIANANGDDGSLGYITNPAVRGKLKTVFTNATYGEIPVWMGGANGEGTVNGYRALVSNQVKSNLTKGTSTTVCSAIFMAQWQSLLLGYFGSGLELTVDPYTNAATRLVNVYATAYVDVQVRHAENFAAMLDALTA